MILKSVAYDLTCFMMFFDLENKCSKRTSMRLLIAPCFRSRRAVPNGGSHLSVAYDLTYFMKVFDGRGNGKTTEGPLICTGSNGWGKGKTTEATIIDTGPNSRFELET